MSRENFFVKLRGADKGTAVYAHLDNIAYVEEKHVEGQLPTVTVHYTSGVKVVVQEPMAEIIAKAAQFGVAKVMG